MEQEPEGTEGLLRTLRELRACGTEEAAQLLRAVRRTLAEWSADPGERGARAAEVLSGLSGA